MRNILAFAFSVLMVVISTCAVILSLLLCATHVLWVIALLLNIVNFIVWVRITEKEFNK